jgi:hypothetical protein
MLTGGQCFYILPQERVHLLGQFRHAMWLERASTTTLKMWG